MRFIAVSQNLLAFSCQTLFWKIKKFPHGAYKEGGAGVPVRGFWVRAGKSYAAQTGDTEVRHGVSGRDNAPVHLMQATIGHGSVATTGEYLHARPKDGF